MKRVTLNLALMAALIGSPMLVGCDDTSTRTEEKTVETKTKPADTKVTTDKEKTTVNPDGSKQTTVEHKVDKE